jgi:hypothetical protein
MKSSTSSDFRRYHSNAPTRAQSSTSIPLSIIFSHNRYYQSYNFSVKNGRFYGSVGSAEAKRLVEYICRVGAEALVEEDDGGQMEGSGVRPIGVIYCADA